MYAFRSPDVHTLADLAPVSSGLPLHGDLNALSERYSIELNGAVVNSDVLGDRHLLVFAARRGY